MVEPGSVPLLVVSAHPFSGGFSRAVAQALGEAPGNEVVELYDGGFDPVLSTEELEHYLDGAAAGQTHAGGAAHAAAAPSVASLQQRVRSARTLALSFPVWWGGPPAMLKGFFDRVLLPGFAFHICPDGRVSGGLTWIQRVHIFCTLDSVDSGYAERTVAAMKQILNETTFGFCGVPENRIEWHVIPAISSTTPEDRRRWLDAARETGLNPDRTPD